MPTYDAILPAGGRIDGEFAAKAGTGVKALIKLGETTILDSILAVLDESGLIGRKIVIGGDEVRAVVGAGADDVLQEAQTGPENIMLGLKFLLSSPNPPEKVLVVTTDLPFLTAEIVKNYLKLCPPEKDVCVPLISATDWHKTYPGTASTFVKLADGEWTSGGIFLIDSGALQSSMPQIQKVFDNRKSVLGMGKLLGPAFLLKLLTKKLKVPDVEQKIQSMLGCTGAAIRNAPTELAYDIDDLEDYEYAVKHAAKTGRSA